MGEEQAFACPWCGAKIEGDVRCPDCGRDLSEFVVASEGLEPGVRLCGHYVVERAIRVDEATVHYLAYDENLQREVEVRHLRRRRGGSAEESTEASAVEDGLPDQDLGTRLREGTFLDEARQLARVEARGLIPAVVDLFVDERGAFVVFEHHEGTLLEEVLEQRGGPVTPDEAAQVMAPVLAALQALHDAGFVHGKVDASWVLVTSDRIYLVPTLGGHWQMTGRTVAVRPTPEAMAARIDAPDLSPEDDVRGACALYYRMVMGSVPPTREEVAGGVGVVAPKGVGVELDETVEGIVMGALAPSPSTVPHGLADLRLALFGPQMGMGRTMQGHTRTTAGWTRTVTRGDKAGDRTGWSATAGPEGGRPAHDVTGETPVAAGAADDGCDGGRDGSSGARPVLIVAVVAVVVLVVGGIVAFSHASRGPATESSQVASLSVGLKDVVVATTSGEALAYGIDLYDEIDVGDWHDVTQVAAGGYHTLGLASDGHVLACGRNVEDQCEVSGWSEVTAVAAGNQHSVGVRADGTVVAMGDDSQGQCDTGGWENVAEVSCGFQHTVGLTADGHVLACGSNEQGQLDVDDWHDVTSVCAGGWHTVGLLEDGTCVAAGDDTQGQCEVASWERVESITCGAMHTVALTADGQVLACGSNDFGQCDVDEWTDVVAVYAGGNYTLGLRGDGSFVGCGNAYVGQDMLVRHSLAELAAPDAWVRLEVAEASPESSFCVSGNGYSARVDAKGGVEVAGRLPGKGDISDWKDVVSLAAGDDFLVGLTSSGTCLICAKDKKTAPDVSGWKNVHAVFAEGDRVIGLLSDGTCVSAGGKEPFDVSGWSDVANVALGRGHAVALRYDGHVVGCGSNEAGQLDVDGWSDVVDVSVGNSHTVGLTSDGTLLACGADDEGQCEVASWERIVNIEAGAAHTVGLSSDGRVYACGANDCGQLDVGSWEGVKAISAGSSWDRTYAVLTGGIPVATGENDFGQLDFKGLSEVVGIFPGTEHTVVIFLDGGYAAVGADHDGQLEVDSWVG